MSTSENVKAAFAGESQARNKYLAFAQKADAEGYVGVAKLFRAAAEAEFIHAQSEFRAMGGVKTTAENLQAAIEGETYEFTTMYPSFIAEAKSDGSPVPTVRAFELANGAERIHAGLYGEALQRLTEKENSEYHVCPVCGHIEKGSAPEQCPICGTSGTKYRTVG